MPPQTHLHAWIVSVSLHPACDLRVLGTAGLRGRPVDPCAQGPAGRGRACARAVHACLHVCMRMHEYLCMPSCKGQPAQLRLIAARAAKERYML